MDFDRVYEELVAPAVREARLALRSWRSAAAGASIQKQALGEIISSDILLADITSDNPNVMYELGVRHAANRGPTVLVRAGAGPAPFYVAYLQTILYDPVGDLAQPEPLRLRLTEALRSAARRSEGSPLYEFFPGLRVELPADLRASDRDTGTYPEHVKRSLAGSRFVTAAQRRINVAAAEEGLRQADKPSPAAYLDILRGYRDASDWNQLIRFADTLPPEVAADPQTLQLLALALNRRSEPGDQDRAVALMQQLIQETGGDAETFGILGRIFKERWRTSRNPEELTEAITCYRRSFELQPTDYYSGFNAVALLFLKNEPAADAELAELLPRVKELLRTKLTSDETDYWVFSVAVEVAVIERNWDEAMDLLQRALTLNPPAWSRVASVDSVERLGRRFAGADVERLERILETLRAGTEDESEDYA